MNLLAALAAYAVATSNAFTPPAPLLTSCANNLSCSHVHVSALALAASSSDDKSVADDLSCGPGFKRVEGADGPCCAYDFDAISSKINDTTSGAEVPFENNPSLRAKFEEKNRIRKNFGLPSLSPEEFVVLQAQIHAMEREQETIQTMAKQAIVEEREEAQRQLKSQAPGMLQNLMGSLFQDTCQSNFDCERPEVCCDFGFKKVCCSSGSTNRDIENELATIPVPQRR